jgi:predicted membrane channel-forming protein YqfA (hemolysin III family)
MEDKVMRMNAPKVLTWLISVILGVVGILLKLNIVKIAQLENYDFLLLAAGFVLLVFANLFKKL